MSQCSEWLRDWLRTAGRTQSDLARLAKVDGANVSRWISGRSRPDSEAIQRLIANLEPVDAAALAVVWVRDQLPAEVARHILVTPISDRAAERPDSGYKIQSLGRDLSEKLEAFGRLALINPDLRRIIDVVFDAITNSTCANVTRPSKRKRKPKAGTPDKKPGA